jgi:hypothetical protein
MKKVHPQVETPKAGRPKGSKVEVTEELFQEKMEERINRINSQFRILRGFTTSRWRNLPDHSDHYNAILSHLQAELEKMKIVEEAVAVDSDFMQGIYSRYGTPKEEATEEPEAEGD